jgi:lysophospholipase L1-like esterase
VTTPPYDPQTACAITAGVTTDGYTEYSGVTWDDQSVALYNNQAIALGLEYMAYQALMGEMATRQLMRKIGNVTPVAVPVLVVGDSISLGTGTQGFTNPQGNSPADSVGYAGLLPPLLDRWGYAASVSRLAVGGITLREEQPNIAAALAAANPSVVVLQFGTNDAAQPDLTDWTTRFEAAVSQCLNYATVTQVVCVEPALSLAQWLASGEQQVDTYVLNAVASFNSPRVVVADWTPLSHRATWDGVHPRMPAALWCAGRVAAAMRPLLPAA